MVEERVLRENQSNKSLSPRQPSDWLCDLGETVQPLLSLFIYITCLHYPHHRVAVRIKELNVTLPQSHTAMHHSQQSQFHATPFEYRLYIINSFLPVVVP